MKKIKINCQKGGTYKDIAQYGYRDDSPYKHLPEITIPGQNITMKGVSVPILGTLSNGQTHLMQPGQEYYFPETDYVKETPYFQVGGPIIKQLQPSPNWLKIPVPPIEPKVPFVVNHEGTTHIKTKDKIYEKQQGGMINQPQQFDQKILGSYVRSLAPREQSQFLQQWEQMDDSQKQELYQAIVQQVQEQPQMQDGGFVHPYDNDFYPEMQQGGAPIWNNLNATAYARNYKPSAEEVSIPPATDPLAGTQKQTTPQTPVTEKEVIKAAQTAVKQGSDVTRIQQALVDAGYKIKVDGVYGPKTQRAVELYQAANKLKVDGVAGKNTLSSLGLNYIDKTFKNTITRRAPVITNVVPEVSQEVEEEQWNFYGPNNPYPGRAVSDPAKSTVTEQPVVQPLSNFSDNKPWYYSLPSGQAQRPNSVLPMSAAAAVNQEIPYNPDDPREQYFRETMGLPMALVPFGGATTAKATTQAGKYIAKNASKVMPAFEQLGSTAAKYSNSIKTSLYEMLPKGTTYDSFFRGGPSNTEKLVDYMVRTGKVAKSEANKLIGELSQYFRTSKPSSSDYTQFFE